MQRTKLIKRADFIIKILIFILSFGFLAERLFFRYHLKNFFSDFLAHIINNGLWILLIVFMMLINWMIETFKWKYLIRKIEKIPIIRAFMAVWAAINLGLFTPYRAGENFGRAFILQKANRWEGIFITFIGSMSQLLITLLFGTTAVWIFWQQHIIEMDFLDSSPYLIFILFNSFFLLIIFLLYFKINILKKIIKIFIPQKFRVLRSHLEIISRYNRSELLKVLSLSFLRFVIFSTQYYLLLILFGVPIPVFDGLIIVSAIYLVITVLPSFVLAELGVRTSASIILMEIYFKNHPDLLSTIIPGAITASFTLWIVNLAIPVMVGVFFVFRLKFFRV